MEEATCIPALIYTVRDKTLRRDVCARVISDGIGRKVNHQLLQWGATRSCHRAGDVLRATPDGAEADTGGVLAERCRTIRLPR